VPIDDTHHWRFEFAFHSKGRLPREDMRAAASAEKLPGDMPRRNPANRYLQARDQMEWSFVGMGLHFPAHDLFVTESQGEIHDRSAEHLVTSDIAIARARRMLLEAIATVQDGREPVGVVRAPTPNDYRDLLVLTERLEADADARAFCAELAAAGIYELNPAVAEQETAPAAE
jgi:hypothetical protein